MIGHSKEQVLPHEWRKLFAMLKTLPNLEAIALRYDKNCAKEPILFMGGVQCEEYRSTLMEWLLSEVVKLPRPLKELAIQNNQSTTELGVHGDAILGQLRSLRLNVAYATNTCLEDDVAEVGSILCSSHPWIPQMLNQHLIL